ncbi:MAG: glycosyltransferase family 4 protein [Haloechinothrix sp.]
MPELVVIADQLMAPVPGGTGRYTAELLRALARTAPRDWSVASVVSRHPDVSSAVISGVCGPRVLPVPRRALAAMWQAGVPYWPGGDAVHAPTPLAPPGRPAFGRFRNASLAVTVHDTVPWSHPHTLTRRGVSWHKAVINRAARRADVIVVPTRSVADELAERVPGGARVQVIGHGVADVFTAAEDAQVRVDVAHLDLPARYVVAVGTLEPRKGLDVLIDAIARLYRAGHPAPHLLLVGQPGWGGLDPLTLAAQCGLPAGAVRVLGRLPDLELAAVLRRAAALAAPSHAEGFGLPVLEAMAAGVPVIHSDAPALMEVAGAAGVAVPRGDAGALADAVRDVLGDPVWSAQLAVAGRRRAAEFSWRKAAEAVWALHTNAARGDEFAGS